MPQREESKTIQIHVLSAYRGIPMKMICRHVMSTLPILFYLLVPESPRLYSKFVFRECISFITLYTHVYKCRLNRRSSVPSKLRLLFWFSLSMVG